MRLIRAAYLPASRWPNGAGRKADIASGDGWMVGYAWLDADAPFSNLAGFDRTITLVEGSGFTLEIAGREPLVMDRLFAPAAFDGGAPTRCRVRGPCRVLNVMTERGRFQHTVSVGAATAEASFIIVLQGAALVGSIELGRLDAVEQLGEPLTVVGENAVMATIKLCEA